jgi:hypothetical protein
VEAGLATTLGGMLHTLHFLTEDLKVALIRHRFMKTPLWSAVIQVNIGGGIVFGIGILPGRCHKPDVFEWISTCALRLKTHVGSR